MRSFNPLYARLRGNESLHHVDLAQHRGRKQRWPRPFLNEVFGDAPIAHMRGSAESRLPVAESPVPSRAGERGPSFDQLLYSIQVEMRNGHHLSNKFRRLCRKRVVHGCLKSSPCYGSFESRYGRFPPSRPERKCKGGQLQNVAARINDGHADAFPVLDSARHFASAPARTQTRST